MRFIYLVSAALLAGGIGFAGWYLGTSMVAAKQPLRHVTVKGLSERDVQADMGFWPIRFVTTGATLDEATAALGDAEDAVRAYLKARGFADDEIAVQNIMVEDRAAGYSSGSTPDEYRYALTEDMLVTTSKVEDLLSATQDVAALIKAGVVFSSDSYSAGASFIFTGIADLKGEMLQEATQRARDSAQQLATESGAKVGQIQTVNQGVFEINPAVDIPNDRPEKQINKKVRVVTTIDYSLVD